MLYLNLMRNKLKPKEVNDALEEGTGSDLPDVTIADNGKLLGVVNGAWNKMDAPASGVNYSTEEQDTGLTWNGKPVYQKTFTGNTGGTETIELLSGVDEFMDTRGYVIGDDYGSKYQIGVYRNSSFLCTAVSGENKLLLVRYGTAYSNKNYCITVQYTKATVSETKKRKTTK